MGASSQAACQGQENEAIARWLMHPATHFNLACTWAVNLTSAFHAFFLCHRDQVAFDLLVVAIIFMAACVAVFLLPLGVSVVAAVMKECGTSKANGDKG